MLAKSASIAVIMHLGSRADLQIGNLEDLKIN